MRDDTTQQSTKNKILTAAKELFYNNGYLNTSFVQIAEKSHTSQGAIYHNFTSKSILGYDVFLSFFETIKDASRTMILKEKGVLDYRLAKMLGVILQFYFFKADYLTYKFYKELHNNRYTGDYAPIPSSKLIVRMATSMDYTLDTKNDEAQILAIIDRELIPRLFISYFDGHLQTDDDYMLKYMCETLFRFLEGEKNKIDELFNEALSIYNDFEIQYKPYFDLSFSKKD